MRANLVRLISVSLTGGALFLASCSSASPTSTPTAAEAKPYGSLTVAGALGSSGILTDPQTGDPNAFLATKIPVFDSLVEMSPEGQLRPGLAERWEISRDGLSHTFYIRKGVKFHNGDDLTGADVKFSLERMLAPDNTHVDAALWRSSVAGIDLKDDYTVVMRFKEPYLELFKGFNNLGGTEAIVPKKYIEEKGVEYFQQHPIGSGPWKVVRFETGSRLELEAVDSHWRAVPKFKNITLVYVPEAATRLAMLKTGELDVATVMPAWVADLKASGLQIKMHDGASGSHLYVFYDLYNREKYAFGDARVRKALSLALNRQEMADKLFAGYARPGLLAYVRPTGYFWDANVLKPDPYDPDQAKRLLAEAGYAGGFNAKLWNPSADVDSTEHTTAVAGYWRKMGVNVTMENITHPALRPIWYPKHTPAIWDTGWVSIDTTGGTWHFERMLQIYHSTKGSLKNT
ncbi:MAG: ABC transporter substrate-binding protein, partial [Chloroflexi bacterium]|nr:ABC transporter substrate-binding protein [Chloroflexota bacterium]